MPVTRIKENQLTDSAVTNAKIANSTIAGGKLAANLTYGSNLVVSGNLTVSGTTTTVDTTTTKVSDPVMLLSSGATGSGSKDIGILGERGDDTNVFIGWDESEDKFVAALTSSAEDSSGTITVTDHANMQMGALTCDDTATVTGNITGGNLTTAAHTSTATLAASGAITGATTAVITGNITGGNLTTAGHTSTVTLAASGAITGATTAVITGNITGGNLTTAGHTDSATYHSSGLATFAQATVEDTTDDQVIVATTGGRLASTNKLTFDETTLTVTGAIAGTTTATITGNITGGNLITAGQTVATGNITGGNLITAGIMDSATIHTSGLATLASAVVETLTENQVVVAGASGAVESTNKLTFDETTLTVTGAVAATTTATVTGNITGGNLITAGLASVTGNITGGNLVTAGTITDGAATISDGAIAGATTIAASSTITATGNITGGNISTAGKLNADGATTLGDLTIDASKTVDAGANRVRNIAAPVADQDAASKKYVDDLLSAGFTLSDGSTTQAVAQGDTLTVAGTANEIEVAVSATDTLTIGMPDDVTIGDTLTVTGNLVVNGTTTTVNTATSTLQDPIFQLGRGADNAALGSNDAKDRGINMFYYSGSEKQAFMGWDEDAASFVFVPDATNTGEVITGDKGKISIGELACDEVKIDGKRIESTGTNGNLELVAAGTGKVKLPTGNELVIEDAADTGIAFSNSGEMTFDATNLYYDGTELSAKNINSDGYVTSTGNVEAGGNVVATTALLGARADVGTGNVDAGNVIIVSALTAGTTATVTGNITGGNLTTAAHTSTATLAASAGITGATTAIITGNITGGNLTTAGHTDSATYHSSGLATFATAVVETLTDNQVVVAGTGGAIQSTTKLTFDETTLTVTGAIAGTTTATITGNVTGGNLITAGALVATGNVSGGNLVSAADVTTVTVTASGAITGATTAGITGNITGGNLVTAGTITDGTATIASGAIAGATTGAFSGTVTAGAFNDGAATYDAGTITSGVAATFSGQVQGATLVGTTSAKGGNITLSGDDITGSNGKVVINDASGDVDFIVESNNNANMLTVDAGGDQVSIGTGTQTADCTFKINATDSMIIPSGTTAQRPSTGVAGMLRYNSTLDGIEYYDVTETSFKSLTAEFTVIQGQTFDGDGSTVAFVLSSSQTTASCIVSINGVVQLPTTAYGVSGTTLTFTEAPVSGDKIEVRQITTTSTITGLSNGDASVTLETGSTAIDTKGDIIPTVNEADDLGSSTRKFKDLYLSSGTLHIGAIQIKESGGKMQTFASNGSTPASTEQSEIVKSGTDGVGNIGQSDNGFNTVFAKATSAQYADLAEKYEADADYEEGTVVMFGGDKEVTKCDEEGCTAVAGIISTNPAYSMNDDLEAEHTAMVALVGRVPCKVTGSIKKGDIIISAGDGKGKASDDPKIGAVIGKALADSEGEGVIEVVVKH